MRALAWRDRTESDSLLSLRGTGDEIAGGTGALAAKQSLSRNVQTKGELRLKTCPTNAGQIHFPYADGTSSLTASGRIRNSAGNRPAYSPSICT